MMSKIILLKNIGKCMLFSALKLLKSTIMANSGQKYWKKKYEIKLLNIYQTYRTKHYFARFPKYIIFSFYEPFQLTNHCFVFTILESCNHRLYLWAIDAVSLVINVVERLLYGLIPSDDTKWEVRWSTDCRWHIVTVENSIPLSLNPGKDQIRWNKIKTFSRMQPRTLCWVVLLSVRQMTHGHTKTKPVQFTLCWLAHIPSTLNLPFLISPLVFRKQDDEVQGQWMSHHADAAVPIFHVQ